MTFNNAVNGSNTDFELSSGRFQFANRTRLRGGYSEDIGIALSGTTLTVQGGDGNALSSTNPGYINLQSLANPGRQLKFSVTANQSFTQAGLGNNLFGVTTGVNITVDMPFYLYAVSNANNGENTIAFMISRIPHRTIAPLAANIGQSGNTNATTQGSFFSLATITAADYASAPCICIGSFRMRYASSLWTVQTINNGDGVGQYQEGINFSFPSGQFGAATGKYFLNNGGTAPDAVAKSYFYFISKNGKIDYWVGLNPITTAGVGAVALKLAVPLQSIGTTIGIVAFINDATNLVHIIGDLVQGVSNTNNMIYQQIPGTLVVLNTNLQINASFSGSGYYYASIS